MNIDRIDHIVLTVRDIDATCAFYSRVLGMDVTTFGAGRKALVFGGQKINLHQAGREFEPKADAPTPGSADFCLIASTPLPEIMQELARHGVPVILGPVRRTGAVGELDSIYIYDPDENLVELSNLVQP